MRTGHAGIHRRFQRTGSCWSSDCLADGTDCLEHRGYRAQELVMHPFFQGRHYVEAVKKCRFHFLRVLYAALEKRGALHLFFAYYILLIKSILKYALKIIAFLTSGHSKKCF